ncbi:CPBP family glutamic-type intramembrane protease [Thermostilla marina]
MASNAGDTSISAPAEGELYWDASQRPLASLMFVAPLLVFYEAGVILLGPEAVRNGAEMWLRELLGRVGFGQYFLLPVATACLLLGQHYLTRAKWYVPSRVLWGMLVESLALAICLRLLLSVQSVVFEAVTIALRPVPAALSDEARSMLTMAVAYVGAGVYEELVFRLILLNGLHLIARQAGLQARAALWLGAIGSSLIFSAAHYVGPYGEPFLLFTFLFRFVAGMFFAVLYCVRGFGIAAGAHAAYDLLVGLV